MTPSDPSITAQARDAQQAQAQNVERFRRLIQVGFGEGNLAIVDELFAPSFVEHQAGVHPPTAQGIKGLISYLHQAFPDLSYTIEDIIASGDRVCGRLRAHGTHHGTFMGLPPSGKQVSLDVIDICRFADSKVVEHWGVADRLGTLEQLGHGQHP